MPLTLKMITEENSTISNASFNLNCTGVNKLDSKNNHMINKVLFLEKQLYG